MSWRLAQSARGQEGPAYVDPDGRGDECGTNRRLGRRLGTRGCSRVRAGSGVGRSLGRLRVWVVIGELNLDGLLRAASTGVSDGSSANLSTAADSSTKSSTGLSQSTASSTGSSAAKPPTSPPDVVTDHEPPTGSDSTSPTSGPPSAKERSEASDTETPEAAADLSVGRDRPAAATPPVETKRSRDSRPSDNTVHSVAESTWTPETSVSRQVGRSPTPVSIDPVDGPDVVAGASPTSRTAPWRRIPRLVQRRMRSSRKCRQARSTTNPSRW